MRRPSGLAMYDHCNLDAIKLDSPINPRARQFTCPQHLKAEVNLGQWLRLRWLGRCSPAMRARLARSHFTTTRAATTNRTPPTCGGEERRLHAVQLSKRQRIAPYGSAVATPNATRGMMTYRFQGDGPALGALYGAVMAPSLALAGHPLAT